MKKLLFCPECGSTNIRSDLSIGKTHRQCEECFQEFFSDVDYSDIIKGNSEEQIKKYGKFIKSCYKDFLSKK